MDAIQAVVDLARENEAYEEKLGKYEDWCDDLIGTSVTLRVGGKKSKTRFVECVVQEYDADEFTWTLLADEKTDNDPEIFEVTFEDFIKGNLHINFVK
jgi:hypothetical protein